MHFSSRKSALLFDLTYTNKNIFLLNFTVRYNGEESRIWMSDGNRLPMTARPVIQTKIFRLRFSGLVFSVHIFVWH